MQYTRYNRKSISSILAFMIAFTSIFLNNLYTVPVYAADSSSSTQSVNATDFTVTGTEVTYDGNNHPVTATCNINEVNNAGFITKYAKLINNEVSDYYTEAPIDAGTYSVQITTNPIDNYPSVTLSSWTLTISRKNLSSLTITTDQSEYTYTGSEIKPTVSVNSGNITLTEGTDYELSYSNNINAGTGTITVSSLNDSNYIFNAQSKTFTISKATPTVIAPTAITGLTYTGESQTLIKGGTTTDGTTMVYCLSETGSYSSDLPTGTEAKTYTIYYKVEGNNNYKNTDPKRIIAIIYPKQSKVTSPPTANTLTYSGSSQALITEGTAENGSMVYSLKDDKNYSSDIPEATDAGTYTIYYKSKGNAGYNDSSQATVTATIKKADIDVNSVTPPTASTNLVYSGSGQDLVLPGSAEGGTMQYKGGSNTDFKESIPKGTDAGTYIIYYKVKGDDNHNDSEVGSPITVTIEKADPVVTAPSANSLTYNGKKQRLIRDGSTTGGSLKYSFDDETYYDSLSLVTDAGNYTVYYKVVGNKNYNNVDAKSISVSINKATPSYTAPKANKLSYTGKAQALIQAGSTKDGTMLYSLSQNEGYSETIPTATEVGKYSVYYMVQGDSNHFDSSIASLTVNITKGKPEFDILPEAISGLVYNGSSQALISPGSAKNCTVTYSFDKNSGYTANIPEATEAGTYNIYCKATGSGNYGSSDVITIKAVISKADPTITALPKALTGLVYNGSAQKLITAGSVQNAVFNYSLEASGSYDSAIPTAVNAGDYTVYYKAIGQSNYNDSSVSSVNVTVSKAIPKLSVSIDSWAAGENPASPVVSGNTENGTVKFYYKTKDADDSEYNSKKPSARGEYRVKAVVEETGNYLSAYAVAEFSITEASDPDKIKETIYQDPDKMDMTKYRDGTVKAVLRDSEGNPVEDAAISLIQGDNTVFSGSSDESGSMIFCDPDSGYYNLVYEKDGITTTMLVYLEDYDSLGDISLPSGINSSCTLDVNENTGSDILVGGLELLAGNADSGSTINMTVKKSTDDSANKELIEEIGRSYELASGGTDFIDFSISSEYNGEVSSISETSSVLELIIPYDNSKRENYSVFRRHEDSDGTDFQAFTKLDSYPSSPADGSFYDDSSNGRLHVFSDKYSIYAFNFAAISSGSNDESEENSNGNSSDDNSSSSSSSSSVNKIVSAELGNGYILNYPASVSYIGMNQRKRITGMLSISYNKSSALTESDATQKKVTYAESSKKSGSTTIKKIRLKKGKNVGTATITKITFSDGTKLKNLSIPIEIVKYTVRTNDIVSSVVSGKKVKVSIPEGKTVKAKKNEVTIDETAKTITFTGKNLTGTCKYN